MTKSDSVHFGPFEFDRAAGELRRRGRPVPIREQALRVLVALLDRPGHLVTREELRHHLWPDDIHVDFERGINKAVSDLRRAIGCSDGRSGLIDTVSKRGYRLRVAVDAVRPATGHRALPSAADAAYMMGRYLSKRRTVLDIRRAIQRYHRSIMLAGPQPRAHAGLAHAHAILGIWGVDPPDQAFSSARRFAAAALRADPQLPEGHQAHAEYLKSYEWSWARAECHYRQALAHDPRCADAHHGYAQLLVSLGRHRQAAVHMTLAQRADPGSAAITAYAPYISLAARRYDHARREAARAVLLEPYSPLAHWMLGRALLCSGKPGEAVSALERASELAGHEAMWVSHLSYARAQAGDRAAAVTLASRLFTRARSRYVSPYDLALACLAAGDVKEALAQLERAVKGRVMRLTGLGDPEFDRLGTARSAFFRLVGLPVRVP